MAEAQTDIAPSLSEQYSLKKDDKPIMDSKPEEVKEVESPVKGGDEEAVETPVSSEKSAEANSAPVEESSEAKSAAAAEDSSEAAPATTEESSEAVEDNSADQDVAEEAREIKLETAPADFRFPTTNQTRHCFTRYIEYHRCVAAKGEDAKECDKFAKYYRSLCPTEWVERWNEQRENGTFPGPL